MRLRCTSSSDYCQDNEHDSCRNCPAFTVYTGNASELVVRDTFWKCIHIQSLAPQRH